MLGTYIGIMTRLLFLLITVILLPLGLYTVASNWHKDRAKINEGVVVAMISVLGFLATCALA